MSFLPKDNALLDKLVFYVLFLLVTFSAIVVFNILNISIPVSVTTSAKSSELAVVGDGRAEAVPDTAYVDAGITVSSVATAAEAQTKIDAVNNKIIDAMKALGIPRENIKTSNYTITPGYSFSPGEGSKIAGYNGNATIQVKIRNLKFVTSVINKATEMGANQVTGTRFAIDDPQKYREMARDNAIANARQQAEKLARTLGIRLGRVVNIVESSPNNPVAYDMKAMAPGIGGGPQLEPGTQTVTSTVTLYFEKR